MFQKLTLWLPNRVATDKSVAALFLLNSVVSSFALGDFSQLPAQVPVHLVDIAAGALGANAVWLGGLAINRFVAKAGSSGRKVFHTLAVWVIAALITAGVPLITTLTQAQVTDISPLVLQSAIGFAQSVLLLLCFTVLVGNWRASRASAQELAARQGALLLAQSSFSALNDEIQGRIRATLREKLDKVLIGLKQSLVESMAANKKELSSLVLEALNQGVRPLSWEISKSTDTEDPLSIPAAPRKSILNRLNYPVALSNGFDALIFTLVCLIFEPSTATAVFGPSAGFAMLVTIAVNLAVFECLRRAKTNLEIRAWQASLVYAAIAYLGGLSFVFIQRALNQTSDNQLLIAFPTSIAEIAFLTSVYSIGIYQQNSANITLSKVNQELEMLVAKLRQSTWQARQRLARLVHGPVQSRLFASYLKLRNEQDLDEPQLQELMRQISEAGSLLESPEESLGLSVSEMAGLVLSGWSQDRTFTINIANELQPPFQLDGTSAECLYETLREAANNAVKYGTAGEYVLNVRPEAMGLIRVELTNPRDANFDERLGQPAVAATSEGIQIGGFGSSVLDMVTLSHRLELTETRALFVALVPATEVH